MAREEGWTTVQKSGFGKVSRNLKGTVRKKKKKKKK